MGPARAVFTALLGLVTSNVSAQAQWPSDKTVSCHVRSTSKLLGLSSALPAGPIRQSRSRSRMKAENRSDLGVIGHYRERDAVRLAVALKAVPRTFRQISRNFQDSACDRAHPTACIEAPEVTTKRLGASPEGYPRSIVCRAKTPINSNRRV